MTHVNAVANNALHTQQTETPKLTPSQVPTLGQYTISSLIRHVYGEDCSVLIEQFGLIPTFNRALQKFTEEYAATLSKTVTTPAVEAEKKRSPVMLKSQKRSLKQSQFQYWT